MGVSTVLSRLFNPNDLVQGLKNPQLAFDFIKRELQTLPMEHVGELIPEDEFEQYRQEIRQSDLEQELTSTVEKEFADISGESPRGYEYTPGMLNQDTAESVYALIRHNQPENIVETGVCNGFSTAYVLAALNKNQKGSLVSIDYPEIAEEYDEAFEELHKPGGAVIPPGKQSGWIVPERFTDRWRLVEGLSQEHLGPVLQDLSHIDMFLHDSEHSYDTMQFEFGTSWSHLNDGGLLFTDDLNDNSAFQDFCRQVNRDFYRIEHGTAVVQK